jgi:hypothetical protein
MMVLYEFLKMLNDIGEPVRQPYSIQQYGENPVR